jgi:8-oxo-dGTP diphosphatase
MFDSEKPVMTLRRPSGQPGIERMATTDQLLDCSDPLVNPGPRVDVRVVLFTVSAGRLLVALQEQGTCRALPLGSPSPTESLDAAGTRLLADHVGIAQRYLEQLYSISHCSEDQWTVTVTYLALAFAGDAGPSLNTAAWCDVGSLPEMDSVDRKIFDYALLRLRAKLGYTTIAFHLLPPSFSLSDLQIIYEAVLGREVDKRNFRRSIHAAGVLEGTGLTRREGSHRPAGLYRFRAGHNAETYLTPSWASSTEEGVRNP